MTFEERKSQVLTEMFIKKAKQIHDDKYDYSKTVLLKCKTERVTITCRIHGDFLQMSNNHLGSKNCCPRCFRPNPPKGPYIKKRPPKPLPDEIIDGKPMWIKLCPKCNRKQTYHSIRGKFKAVKDNAVCKWCQNTIYPTPPRPWVKRCVDCGDDVMFITKWGLLSQKSCRCKDCLKSWLSKIITDKQCQITKSGYRYRPYTFSKDRIEMVQGYEPYTLNYLISSSISPDDIRVKGPEKPKIDYEFGGSIHLYIPDAYISSSNTIVETKSSWTWTSSLDRNVAKIKGENDTGYDMRVIIWDDKKLISDTLYPADI